MAGIDLISVGHGPIKTPRKQTFGTTICRQLRAKRRHQWVVRSPESRRSFDEDAKLVLAECERRLVRGWNAVSFERTRREPDIQDCGK